MREENLIKKLDKPVDVTIKVPASKSILARMMILGALSYGKCVFDDALLSKDTEIMMEALRDLGFSIFYNESARQLRLQGRGGDIPVKKANIYVGSAGTAARFLTAMLALSDGEYTINASEQMSRRPMGDLLVALRSTGAEIICIKEEGYFPITVKGKRPVKPVKITVDASKSTQFASGILLMMNSLPEGSECEIVGENRTSYIELTKSVIDNFNQKTKIEPDISAACYVYESVMIAGGSALVKRVHLDSAQADLRFIKLLEKLGASLEDTEDGIRLEFNGDLSTQTEDLEVDMAEFSDQTMTLAALASLRKGKTTIKNIGHIRKQESDRMNSIKENIERIGLKCELGESDIVIFGGNPHKAVIKSFSDHRVAMSFALLGLKLDGMAVDEPQCVNKSFPGFWDFVAGLY